MLAVGPPDPNGRALNTDEGRADVDAATCGGKHIPAPSAAPVAFATAAVGGVVEVLCSPDWRPDFYLSSCASDLQRCCW